MTTASEKLKELGAGFDRVTPICRKTGPKMLGADAYVHAKDIHAYVDALPQIVAVIEAAGEVTHQYDLWSEGADDGEFRLWDLPTLCQAIIDTRAALRSLNESLS